jgi:kynureninase
MDDSYAIAQRLDAQDELARFREEFVMEAAPEAGMPADKPGLIYLDGNSLGRLPRRSVPRLVELVEQEWGQGLIRGWNAGWYTAATRIGEKIARLVGAAPGQVIATDTTSINLFKLVMAALLARPGRSKIISDTLNFPSDLYILQGCAHLLGERLPGDRPPGDRPPGDRPPGDRQGRRHRLVLIPSPDGIHGDPHALYRELDADTALVTLSHVTFKSGYLYEAAAITQRAQAAGALVLWDLSHAAGAVPVELDAWNADLAVGCTYKYLNGGPGAPAYLYVRKDLQETLLNPIWGWFGQRTPFAFDLDYTPAPGIAHFLVSSPPVISLATVEPALDLLLEAGMKRLRRKSVRQTSYLIERFEERLQPLGFTLGSPRDAERRGSHVSLRHPEGYRINRALIEELNLIPDFREPDNLRLGIAPLYTTYSEIWEGVERIRQVVEQGLYLRYPAERLAVT